MNSRQLARTWPYGRHKTFEVALRKVAAHWFRAHNTRTQAKYPYILPEWKDWPANIIVPEVAKYIAAEAIKRRSTRLPFPLHKYLHHGLSSQALLFNLVGPLIISNDLSPLQTACQAAGIPWPQGCVQATLETADRKILNEHDGQPTSIDLMIRGDLGAPLYIEAKFVEQEFGVCSVFTSGDCDGQNPAADFSSCYLHHIDRYYWKLMWQRGLLQGPLVTSPTCIMANYYQFFREILFAIANNGYFVLLYDARNPTFVRNSTASQRGLLPFLISLVPDNLRENIKAITIQQVFHAIVSSGQHDRWVGEFARKYGLAKV